MICHSCQTEFGDYKSLALHIMSTKKGHKQGRTWAARFLAQVNKKEFSPRTPFSEETKQTIKDCVREFSGKSEKVRTVCPNCRQVMEQRLEVEYIHGGLAWRNSNGTFIVNCSNCKKEK